MIIYTDSENNLSDMFGVKEVTPAHLFTHTRDFSIILDDIARGKIPSGTGKPFNVVWTEDAENKNTSNMNGSSTGLFDPWIK